MGTDREEKVEQVPAKIGGWRGPLLITAIGVISFPLSFVGGWGPCGPSSPVGFLLMLVGFICVPLGILWLAGRGMFRLIRRLIP
jgi:hypothetical protein